MKYTVHSVSISLQLPANILFTYLTYKIVSQKKRKRKWKKSSGTALESEMNSHWDYFQVAVKGKLKGKEPDLIKKAYCQLAISSTSNIIQFHL